MPIRVNPTVHDDRSVRSFLAIITSPAHSSVAPSTISWPRPKTVVAPPPIPIWPTISSVIAATCRAPSRSPSSGIASRATQTSRVF